ncbi:MAG: hypothetical protein ACE5D3_08840 [Candidatus Binatia bacterium]
MKTRALQRIEKSVEQLAAQRIRMLERERQLQAALSKSREELDRAKGQVERFKSDRAAARKTIDALLKRIEGLNVDWEQAEP